MSSYSIWVENQICSTQLPNISNPAYNTAHREVSSACFREAPHWESRGVAVTGNQLQFHCAKGPKTPEQHGRVVWGENCAEQGRDSCSNSSVVTAWALIASDDARSEQSQTMVCHQFLPALSFIMAIKMEGKSCAPDFAQLHLLQKVDRQKDASPWQPNKLLGEERKRVELNTESTQVSCRPLLTRSNSLSMFFAKPRVQH